MTYYLSSGLPVPGTSRTPAQIQPRFSAYLASKSQLITRLKSPWLSEGLRLSSVGVDARTGSPRRISAAPGKILKFEAGLHGRPPNASTAYVNLVNTSSGAASQSFSHSLASSDPNLPDVWQVVLPSSTPSGQYSIRYDLHDAKSGAQMPLQAETDVVAVKASNGATSYEIGRLDVTSQAGVAIGQHFHGHPGAIGGDARGTDPILVPYNFARSHDSSNVGGTSWWVEDTVNHSPDGTFNWTEFDRWANFHATGTWTKVATEGASFTASGTQLVRYGFGTSWLTKTVTGSGQCTSSYFGGDPLRGTVKECDVGQRNLLITFYGSPTWASSRPTEPSQYSVPGLNAPPANLTSYQKMVKTTIAKYSGRVFAAECWNEPSQVVGPGSFFTGTGTQLADICKAIYVSTKAVDASIPVICPANADFNWLLNLKTSLGEPIHQFCDWVNIHPYDATGNDLNGAAFSMDSLGDVIDVQEQKLKALGLNKPIAITEWGMSCADHPTAAHPTHFHDMDSQSRGDLLYQVLGMAKEKGVVAFGLYSYDSGSVAGATSGAPDCKYGYEGIGLRDATSGQYTYDATTAQSVSKAVRDFGKQLP